MNIDCECMILLVLIAGYDALFLDTRCTLCTFVVLCVMFGFENLIPKGPKAIFRLFLKFG
jgi:hypothetical protein